MLKNYVKKIYDALPFKRHLFQAVKRVLTPPEYIYRHLHFKGWFWVKSNADYKFKLYNQTIIENEIFWNGLFGRWEKESLKIWVKLAKKSRYIIDVGANTGVYALLAKAVSQHSVIFALEPHPHFFNILKRNIEVNNFIITPLDYAASNIEGNVTIDDYTGHARGIEVKSITLKSLIESNNIPRIDLMKIDVETFEPEVLDGMGKYLQIFKPSLVIEILNDQVADKIEELIEGVGYLKFNIDEIHGLTRVDRLKKSSSLNYLLATEESINEIFT